MSPNSKIQVINVSTPNQLGLIRELFREYQIALGVTLDFQDFKQELRDLPGEYAPPKGALLICLYEGKLAGCVALKAHSSEICEMKRLYIRPDFRKCSLGRLMAEEIIVLAKSKKYKKMRLDSLPFMKAAQGLYYSLGFKEVAPYYHNPIEGTVYMEADL